MADWISRYMQRAFELSRMTIYERGYTATWNALEDDVLARSREQQHALWDAAIANGREAGMVIMAMLPLDLGSQDDLANTY